MFSGVGLNAGEPSVAIAVVFEKNLRERAPFLFPPSGRLKHVGSFRRLNKPYVLARRLIIAVSFFHP